MTRLHSDIVKDWVLAKRNSETVNGYRTMRSDFASTFAKARTVVVSQAPAVSVGTGEL